MEHGAFRQLARLSPPASRRVQQSLAQGRVVGPVPLALPSHHVKGLFQASGLDCQVSNNLVSLALCQPVSSSSPCSLHARAAGLSLCPVRIAIPTAPGSRFLLRLVQKRPSSLCSVYCWWGRLVLAASGQREPSSRL